MNPIVRFLLPVLFLVAVALPGATVTSDARAAVARPDPNPVAARNAACVRGGGRPCRYVELVVRAGRVTVVKTTWALGRALEHGFHAGRAAGRSGR